MWKPVPGYEDEYEVSDTGQFRRVNTRFGRVYKTPRPIKLGDNRGYAKVALSKDGQVRHLAAHRVVWEAFMSPIPDGMQINHKNGNKRDNRISNLEVVTPSENTRHAFRVLKVPPNINPNHGERNGHAKLTQEDVRKVRSLRKKGWSQQKIADHFGIHQTGISRILRGDAWKTPN